MDGAGLVAEKTDAATALFRTYNAHDAAAAASLYRPEGWHEEVNTGRRREGFKALRIGLERFFVMLPDAQWLERERVRCRDNVAVVYTLTGRMAADLGSMPAKGKLIRLPGIQVVEADGDLIVGTRDFWDPDQFERQIRDGVAT